MLIVMEQENIMRGLLLVSYWYPPAMGAAAERMDAFARYLPEYGWHTHVLTAARDAGFHDMPHGSVHRVRDRMAKAAQPFPDYDPRRKQSRLRGLFRGLAFPDRFVFWQRAAFDVGKTIIATGKIDLILASFPPASAAMLGLRLCQQKGIPLVLDMRDRWFGPGGYEPTGRRSRHKHEQLRREVVTRATAVVTVSQAMADALADEYRLDRSRVFVVPNGYEPDDGSHRPLAGTGGGYSHLAGNDVDREETLISSSASGSSTTSGSSTVSDSSTAPASFTIAHVGTVIPRNRPDLFFESIITLKDHACLRRTLFKFVGNLSQAWLDAVGLTSVVQTTGMLSRDRARREMRAADALLLLTGSYVGKWGNNAKLFEYLQTSLPILCLEETPHSNDRKMLERFAPERSFIAPLDDPQAIAEQICRLLESKSGRSGLGATTECGLECYSRRNQVGILAEHLNEIV